MMYSPLLPAALLLKLWMTYWLSQYQLMEVERGPYLAVESESDNEIH